MSFSPSQTLVLSDEREKQLVALLKKLTRELLTKEGPSRFIAHQTGKAILSIEVNLGSLVYGQYLGDVEIIRGMLTPVIIGEWLKEYPQETDFQKCDVWSIRQDMSSGLTFYFTPVF